MRPRGVPRGSLLLLGRPDKRLVQGASMRPRGVPRGSPTTVRSQSSLCSCFNEAAGRTPRKPCDLARRGIGGAGGHHFRAGWRHDGRDALSVPSPPPAGRRGSREPEPVDNALRPAAAGLSAPTVGNTPTARAQVSSPASGCVAKPTTLPHYIAVKKVTKQTCAGDKENPT